MESPLNTGRCRWLRACRTHAGDGRKCTCQRGSCFIATAASTCTVCGPLVLDSYVAVEILSLLLRLLDREGTAVLPVDARTLLRPPFGR